MRNTLIAAIALFATPVLAEWQLEGFEMPESTLYDAERNQIVVSNIVGNPMEADGQGYLSLVSPSGELLSQRWATGMDAPKGLAVVGDRIYVADLTKLHVVDADTGSVLQSVEVPDAKFLNDITASSEGVYISDMLTHTIWHFHNGVLNIAVQSPDLNHPNGLLWRDGALLIGSWGPDMQADFSTSGPGDLLSWSPDTDTISVVAPAVGNIDGIVERDGALVISDWISGALWRLSADAELSKIAQYPAGLADIGATESEILIPHMLSGRVEAVAFD
ncbi:MAG: hypothetical protein JXQ89_05345 [Pelagimonas sp.]